jgi:DNA-3-methyladenine glycosylase
MAGYLPESFFARPTLTVARDLLGQRLVRQVDGQRLSGIIVETEAYIGPNDTASHASKGRTPRTRVMFGPPGHTYVYLIYGMYHMLNIVTERDGFPAAVLIRALEPLEGVAHMQARRGKAGGKNLTNGPGKLCRAMAIDLALNNWSLGCGQDLWLEAGPPVPAEAVAAGPRIGIDYAAPADRSAAWRFWLRGNSFVSQ